VLLDDLCAMERWPDDGDLPGPMGLLRKRAVAVRLRRFRSEPLVADKAQATRELRLLNNSQSPAHMVHDFGEPLPPNHPANVPFNQLPWSYDQWRPAHLVSDMEFNAQTAARFDCDGDCEIRNHTACRTHGGHCWRFQAKITLTKAPCVARWIKERLGLGTALSSGCFVVSSSADLHTFFQTVVEPFSVRKGQRYAFMWLVCMQQHSLRHGMPFAPPRIDLHQATGLSDWMDAAVGCGITVWDCSS
jgi:hypothetical protein